MRSLQPAALTASALLAALAAAPAPASAFTLTLLHNNDGESDVLANRSDASLNPGGGDAARFATLVDQRRGLSTADGLLTLTSGDNFLAGPEFNASRRDFSDGLDFYDARVVRGVGYDALTLGNHDFDFGPDVLADFITASQPRTGGRVIPFLSANLDFSAEPALQDLFDRGLIARSATFDFGGERVGVVGGTTPNLPFISSPRNTRVLDPFTSIQDEVDRLTADGVNKIVLSSHLQGVEEDLALIPRLANVDVAIAGGGDELLSPYPLSVNNAGGVAVPVVTAPGGYEFLGDLSVTFDDAGVVTDFFGSVFNVDGSLTPDAGIQSSVVDPVAASVDALATNVIAQSEVSLDERRSAIRSRETGAGNLIADSQLDAAERLATSFGANLDGNPLVSLANSGGIRTDAVIPAGDYTELQTFNSLPFGNFVGVVEDVDLGTLKLLLENAVSRTSLDPDTGEVVASGGGTGRFAQVGGLSFTYDPEAAALSFDADGNVLFGGERVLDLTLDDGTQLIEDGEFLLDAANFTVDVVTNSFSAGGGDQYPFGDEVFTRLGLTGQEALADYVQGTLGGVIPAGLYGAGSLGRITAVPEPATAAVLAAGGLLLGRRRRA